MIKGEVSDADQERPKISDEGCEPQGYAYKPIAIQKSSNEMNLVKDSSFNESANRDVNDIKQEEDMSNEECSQLKYAHFQPSGLAIY